jgi:hypothetical protein
MAYKCLDYGHIFEEGEQAVWKEDCGEFWGSPCSETLCGCPVCHGYFEETKKCLICGCEHLEDELNYGICDECIDNHKYNVDMCFKLGATEAEELKLNSFLTFMFNVEEIEEILLRELKQAMQYTTLDCENFINSDRNWFAEKLAGEVGK